MKKLCLTLVFLVSSAFNCQATRVVLDNVPQYDHLWDPIPGWNGCTPRAAGSLMAYWDSQPGFGNLYKKGDAQVWGGDVTQGTRRMVASQRYSNNDLDPSDCLSSFLGTNRSGGTQPINIRSGLEGFAEWDDTSTYDMKDAYQANTSKYDVSGGSLYISDSFGIFKSEIDAGRPVLMTVKGYNTSHSVLAYGYDDDITYDLYDVDLGKWVTMPAFAVMDTWVDNTGNGSRWWNWEDHGNGWELTAVEEIFDGGHEWWPFFPHSNFYMGGDDANMEWQVSEMYTLELEPVPEPTTILLFALGGVMLRRKHRV